MNCEQRAFPAIQSPLEIDENVRCVVLRFDIGRVTLTEQEPAGASAAPMAAEADCLDRVLERHRGHYLHVAMRSLLAGLLPSVRVDFSTA